MNREAIQFRVSTTDEGGKVPLEIIQGDRHRMGFTKGVRKATSHHHIVIPVDDQGRTRQKANSVAEEARELLDVRRITEDLVTVAGIHGRLESSLEEGNNRRVESASQGKILGFPILSPADGDDTRRHSRVERQISGRQDRFCV